MHRQVPFTLFLLLAILASMVPAGLVQAQGPVVNPPQQNPAGPVMTTSAPPPDKGTAPAGNPEPLAPGIDAVASYYNFSSFSGTYSEISGGTLVTTSCDDTSYNNYAIGFTFTYDAVAYTVFSIQCNGFIAMGPTVASSYAPISTGTTNNVISALGGDLQTNTSNSEIRYQVLGSSPNQVLVVQYKNFRPYGGTGYIYNFQIRLYETTNVVEVVYGEFTSPSTYYRQVGLRGASNADYNNRMTDASHFWANSLPGTANSSTMTLGPGYLPSSGLTYQWIHIPAPAFDTSTKTASVARIVTGGWYSYTITINNTGDMAANGTMMTDTLPLEVAYRAGSLSCPGATCSYDAGNHRILWTGNVAVGGSTTVYFEVDATGCGTAVNSAWIKHPPTGKQVTRTAITAIVSMLPTFLEGFEVSVPPPGWTETIVDDPGTDPDWTRESAGTYPTISPHGGTYMAKFNSFNASNGASARLWSGALDLSGYVVPAVVFWMSHDTGYSASADRIQFQVSTDGVNWVDVGAPVLRYDAAFTTPGWKEHVVVLPAGYNINGVYIGFLGISAYGNNFYLDDVSLAEGWYPCPVATLGPTQAKSACRASDVTYSLVAGTNYMTDTYDLWSTGNAWPTTPDPTSLVLGPGDTEPVAVTVHVPWNAPLGSTDVASIHLGGQTYGLAATANLATTAIASAWDTAWQNMATGSPTPLYWGASYYDSGKVCFVGGMDNVGAVTAVHQCYDIATVTWSNRAALPGTRFAPAYGWIGGKFYLAGGFDSSFNGSSDLYIYDPGTDSWSTGASMPSARGGQAGGVVNGKLYSAGGSDTSSFPTDCPTYEYDPVLDTWTTLASCPLQGGYGFVLGGSVGSDVNGRLYAGGHFGDYTGWYAFDPVANIWTTLANLPGGVHKTPLMVERPDTGQIYMIGGMVGWAGQQGVWEYDVAGNSWSAAPPDIITAQGGSLGPAQGSFADPSNKGFWTFGGTVGSYAITPAPFEYWAYIECPPVVPDIVVTPEALSAEQCADTVTTQMLQICNNGIAPLNWTISELSETLSLGEVVQVTLPAGPATAPAGTAVAAGPYRPRPETVRSVTRRAGIEAPPDVLLLAADDDNDYGSPIQAMLQAYGDLGAVDLYDPRSQTPTLAELQAYDVVVVWSNYSFADATAIGDVLADYVDAGGKVIDMMFALDPSWGYQGRFRTQGYTAFTTTNYTFGNSCLGTYDPTHPVMSVPTPITNVCEFYRATGTALTAGSTAVARWADNEIFVGVKDNRTVVTINGYVGYYYQWTGQMDAVLHNAIWWLMGTPPYDVPWLSENPTSGQTWMGECTDVVVTFDSAGMAPGSYTAGLLIGSDDPDTPAITVPVSLLVQTPPEIEITAPPLWAELCPDETLTFEMNICNLGECDLAWELHEYTPTLTLRGTPFVPVNVAGEGVNPGLTAASPRTKLVAVPSSPEDVLWDQPLSSVDQNAYVDQEFTDYPDYSSFLADDFSNADPWVIESIFVPGNGWNGFTSILNATALTWQIYEDCGGVPCGDPHGGGNPPVWTLTLPPNDPQVVVTNGSGGMPSNVQLNLAAPGILPPGTWWFIFYPTAAFSGFGQYGRQPADTTNGYTGQFINPGGGFGYGTTWQPWSIIGATQQDIAFRIEGTIYVPYPDFPWVSEAPISGTVPGGECTTVDVTFDATGLTPGDYLADIVIESNDADEPEITLPVTLTVQEPPEIDVPPVTLEAELCPDGVTTLTMDICNVGECGLDWNLEEGTWPLASVAPRLLLLPAQPATTNPAAKAHAPAQWPRWLQLPGGSYPQATYQVLLVSPDSSMGDISLLLSTLAAYPDLVVTVWDNAAGNPTAADMAAYDVVFIGNDYTWESAGLDKTAIGDALADYIDAGGKVIESEFVQSYDQWGFAGRYMTDGYSPFTPALNDFPGIPDTMNILEPTHPVMQGVTNIGDARYQQDPGLQAGATLLADWTNTGNHAVAVNDNVVALNLLIFHSAGWTGDVGLLLHNAIVWLNPAFDIPWLSEDPTSGTVAAGACQTVTVTFDATGLAGGTYTGALEISSDDPDTPLLTVPVTLTVQESPSGADFTWFPPNPFVGEQVAFTGTVAGGTAPFTWTWAFGDGTYGSGPNPTHAYAAAGTYTVRMTVTNDCGEDYATYDVTVVEGCVEPSGADFTWSPNSPIMGEVVHFTGTVAGGTPPITYAWDFGDGGTGSGANPTHVYAAAGTYTVRMTATNGCGEDYATYDIVVVEGCVPPTGADFTWLPPNPAAGQVVAFTGSTVGGTPPITFAWSFGDGGTDVGNPINHTYTLEGTYTVVMTATNACGAASATHDVVVSAVGPTYYYLYLPIIFKNY